MELISGETTSFVAAVMNIMATLFVVMVGIGVLAVIVIYILDITQTTHAIRRNYPVAGRFRYFLNAWASFSGSTFLPWTARNCHSTAPSVPGSSGLPRT